MQAGSAESMMNRLTAINWTDYAAGDRHAVSRTLLMREFLRRAALWVEYLGGSDRWPFIDIAERVDPSVRADEQLIEQLDEFMSDHVPEYNARRACRAAVHWEMLREHTQVGLPDLEDPYEPLIVLYERGGVFFVENGVADFEQLRRVPLRSWQANVATDPIVQLDRSVLDALDAA
ncbi:hypothetical protein [Streptomyces cinnamoneus]|uniref:hypothetical protein n=1 Tax=Streptomyces cinnamoneus TaxID=53446 RepID=UPI003F56C0FA